MLLRVKDWQKRYGSRTKSWLKLPCCLDKAWYATLVDHERGAEFLGCWVALVLAAGQGEPPGLLCRPGGKPHSPLTLATITLLPTDLIAEVIEKALYAGLLEIVTEEDLQDPPEEAPVASHEDFVGLELYEGHRELQSRWEAARAALEKACPGINIRREVAAAHAWEVANPGRRKVDKVRFLHRWCKRAQDGLFRSAPAAPSGPARKPPPDGMRGVVTPW